MVRAFVAVEIGSEQRKTLARETESLRDRFAAVRWVTPENWHLTLKFLGEIGEDQIPDVTNALRAVSSEYTPFVFGLEGTGVFPGPGNARIFWVGVSQGRPQLQDLAAAVEKRLQLLGFDLESKPFHPHVTLGRVRKGKKVRERNIQDWEKAGKTFGKDLVRGFTLFESRLSASGSRYEPIAQLEFPSSFR